MRISLPPPSGEEIKRLEAAAAARPQLYRMRLALLAIAGDVLLTGLRVLPLAGPFAPAALFLNTGYRVVAAVALLLLIWIMRPDIRDRGKKIAQRDAPRLYGELDDLKAALDVRQRIEVWLDDGVGAGAREGRGFFGLLGTRRVLTLGLPLLALLGRDEARAVIAHEFGHFSRRHGRLGHWLYWAHLDWLSYAERIDEESSILERSTAFLAERFAPPFSRRAMVWSRRCEYEADADAARTVGGRHVVSALVRLDAFDAWHANEFPRLLREWQRDEPSPPDDILGRTIAAFEKTPPDSLAALAASEASRSGDWLDTHPRLTDRAAALGVQPSLVPRGARAGPVLLASLWPTAAADYNKRWRNEHAVAWSVTHMRHRLIEAPLLAAAPATLAAWPIERRLDRARALRRIEPARGLAELETLRAAVPGDRGIMFACASARLADGDTTAVKALTALAEADAGWRMPVCTRLVHHFNRIGDRASANRWADRLERAGRIMMYSYAWARTNLVAGKLPPTTRPPAFIETLRAGLCSDPAIAKAWIFEGQAPLACAATARAVTFRVDALILLVDPFDAVQQSHRMDAVKARQQLALAELIEPDVLPVTMSFYSTEPLTAALQAALERHPPGSTYTRRAADYA